MNCKLTLAGILIVCALLPSSAAGASNSPPGFFGVSENQMTERDYDLLAEADAGVIRTGLIFNEVKPEENGPYQWQGFDHHVTEASQHGIEVVPILFGVPSWISEERSQVPMGTKPLSREWREFLTAAVQRYGPGGEFWEGKPVSTYRPIEVWQVWNEPNSITWWAPRPDPVEYAELLDRSARAIEAVDPGARVMTAGIVARPTNEHAIRGPEYLKRLFAVPKARAATDVLAFHPFAPSVDGVRGQTVNARRTLDRAGLDETPIWITEVGWGSRGPERHALIKTERGQERVLSGTFRMVLDRRERLGVERLIWYHWRDYRDDLCRWCESSGLINRKLGRKHLFGAFEAIATPPVLSDGEDLPVFPPTPGDPYG